MAFLLGCAMTLGTLGCGSDSTGPASYDEYIVRYVRADCDRDQRCSSIPAHESVDECVAAVAPDTARQRTRIAESVKAGKTSYDSGAAQTCLDLLAGGCETSDLDVLQACNKVIEGKVAVGQPCIGHFECDPGDGTSSNGPWCFDGCTGLFGGEDPEGAGTCVATSPARTPQCT
jgi:hypothetical protein